MGEKNRKDSKSHRDFDYGFFCQPAQAYCSDVDHLSFFGEIPR